MHVSRRFYLTFVFANTFACKFSPELLDMTEQRT
jgi:hypothetical protein